MNVEEAKKMTFSFEEKLNKLFFSKDFKEKMVTKFHYCPNGLTIDPDFDEENNEWSFGACCKKYGYDYSGEPTNGDFIMLKTSLTNDIATFMLNYIEEKDKELAEIVSKNYYYYNN